MHLVPSMIYEVCALREKLYRLDGWIESLCDCDLKSRSQLQWWYIDCTLTQEPTLLVIL